jgi:hypothetical protein
MFADEGGLRHTAGESDMHGGEMPQGMFAATDVRRA